MNLILEEILNILQEFHNFFTIKISFLAICLYGI